MSFSPGDLECIKCPGADRPNGQVISLGCNQNPLLQRAESQHAIPNRQWGIQPLFCLPAKSVSTASCIISIGIYKKEDRSNWLHNTTVFYRWSSASSMHLYIRSLQRGSNPKQDVIVTPGSVTPSLGKAKQNQGCQKHEARQMNLSAQLWIWNLQVRNLFLYHFPPLQGKTKTRSTPTPSLRHQVPLSSARFWEAHPCWWKSPSWNSRPVKSVGLYFQLSPLFFPSAHEYPLIR